MELRIAFFECEVLLLGTARTHGGRSSRRDARESAGKREAREGSSNAKELWRRDEETRVVDRGTEVRREDAADDRRDWVRDEDGVERESRRREEEEEDELDAAT